MAFEKKNKYEKSLEQIAYEYGIGSAVRYLENLFVQYRHEPDVHDNIGSINFTFENQQQILSELEQYKNIDYPPHCGTCGARFD